MNLKTKKLVFAALFVALGVICSPFSIPVGASKCFPVQHLINVLGAVLLGPWLTIAMAFSTSLIRLALATGTLLAFPGSMIGAFLASILYKLWKKKSYAFCGEVIGTGFFGAIVAYFIAKSFMAKEVALFFYCIPFVISSIGGTIIAGIILLILEKNQLTEKFKLPHA